MNQPLFVCFIGMLLWAGCTAGEAMTPEEIYTRALAFETMGYPKEAGHWYRKAAFHGHPVAQVEVGFMYKYGKAGLLHDPYEAERWFGNAAREAPFVALADFGDPSEYGTSGVLRDDGEASYWFRKAVHSCREAARKGDLKAQTLLGGLYGSGMGTRKDRAEALRLWGDAAEKGHAQAQYWLARACWHRGEYKAAFPWMVRAAEQGWPAAQYQLSLMYQYGYGVEPDYKQAVRWLQQSAARGYLFAVRQLKGMQASGSL